MSTFWATFWKIWATFYFNHWSHWLGTYLVFNASTTFAILYERVILLYVRLPSESRLMQGTVNNSLTKFWMNKLKELLD